MRHYSNTVKQRVKTGPNTAGLQLAREAVRLDLSIIKIAQLAGASRMTVYNWFSGRGVTNAYKARVQDIINTLKAAPDRDAAWSTACKKFNVNN